MAGGREPLDRQTSSVRVFAETLRLGDVIVTSSGLTMTDSEPMIPS